jgi:uncharacterized protein (TIGR02001 family)
LAASRARLRDSLALIPVTSSLLVFLAAPARAQVAVSATLTSDFRFRGISLSDRKPALSLNLAYDHPSGLYVGVSAIGAETAHSGVQALGYQADVGYAIRTRSGVSWDVGVTNADFTEYFKYRYRINYSEIYTGFAINNISAHVYYSPDYLGESTSTVYVELDGAIHPAPHLRLFGHVGMLTPLVVRAQSDIRRPQYDLRAGVAAEFRSCELQLAWTTVGPDLDYPGDHAQVRDAFVVSVTYFF